MVLATILVQVFRCTVDCICTARYPRVNLQGSHRVSHLGNLQVNPHPSQAVIHLVSRRPNRVGSHLGNPVVFQVACLQLNLLDSRQCNLLSDHQVSLLLNPLGNLRTNHLGNLLLNPLNNLPGNRLHSHQQCRPVFRQ